MTTDHLEHEPADAAKPPTRRGLLIGGAAVATSAAVGSGFVRQAAQAATYTVNPFLPTGVPSAGALHMMNRMGCGYSRSTWAELKAAGGPDAWFEQQLKPEMVAENAMTNSLLGWFPALTEPDQRKWKRNIALPGNPISKSGWEYARDLANYSMLRRMYSSRPVLETMVDFWSNHLHIPTRAELAWVQRFDYDRLIRRHALGRFEDMLVEATLHPAMVIFLDNIKSVKNAPNENHGRELLELHTVGRTSGYSEDMVKDAAKILSGYTVHVRDEANPWTSSYSTDQHTTGAVSVLGFSHPNTSANGEAMTRDFLRYLANHPATALTIARKLATRFVSDTPSDALVDHLADVFRREGTDIEATLRALVAHPEFKASAGQKVRTPIDDLVATAKVLQVKAEAPAGGAAYAHNISYVQNGMLLYQWPRPDGPPDRNSAWSSATRVLGSFRMHWMQVGGYYPVGSVAYRTPGSWIPQPTIRFDRYVDHLCRMLHGRPSTPKALKAAVEATGLTPATIVSRQHRVAGYMGVRLIGALLDTPTHMTR